MIIKKGYKKTVVGEIPVDWEVVELGEIGFFKNGINKAKTDFGFGSPFINLMDVFGKSKIEGSEKFDLINSNDAEKTLYDLQEGDVIFVRSSVKPSGVGLTTVIKKDLPSTVFSGFLIRFRENGTYLDTNYKVHCFYQEAFRNRLIASSTVSANTNINQEALKLLKIPLPPLPEQKAIAKVLSDMDNLITALEAEIEKMRLVKQGAMQELLTAGEDWEVRSLGEVCFTISSGKSNTKSSNGNYPIYGSTGIIGFSNKWDYLGEKILVARVGANAGTVNKVKGSYCVSDNTLIVNYDNSKINIDYLFYFLIKKKLQNLVFGSGQPLITGGQLKNLNMQLPPLSEQTRIAKILTDIDLTIGSKEAELEKYRAMKVGLMQELLSGKRRLVRG